MGHLSSPSATVFSGAVHEGVAVASAYRSHACETCGSKIRIHLASGYVPVHFRPRGGLCPDSSMMLYVPDRRARPGTPRRLPAVEQLGDQEASDTRKPRRLRILVAPPPWFPKWDGDVLPSIALPAQGRIGVWVPQKTEAGLEELIKQCLSSRVRPDWDSRQKCLTVAADHFIRLANALLDRFPRIAVGREYRSDEECKPNCLAAAGHRCTCSCKARNHGHGRWMEGWRITAEATRAVQSREWNWIVVERNEQHGGPDLT